MARLNNHSVTELARQLTLGRVSSTELLSQAIDEIWQPNGQGQRAFISVADSAVAEAQGIDQQTDIRRRQPFAGIPVSIKDLFDIKGQVTTAGSVVLRNELPAARDARAVANLRRAGFIFVGRTNMTEFAYSGLGLNPHYGTPLSPYQRESERIAGGSSSGGAVSVTDGMSAAAIGTDTGGSCRIPAAWCGITGFKPTAKRISLDGVIPLSPSMDSVGVMSHSVKCCAIVDGTMSGTDHLARKPPNSVAGIRLGLLTNHVLEGLDHDVASAFEQAVQMLSREGVEIQQLQFAELSGLPQLHRNGGIVAYEAYQWHQRYLHTKSHAYDPRVRDRIVQGFEQSDSDIIELRAERALLIAAAERLLAPVHALICPTVAIVPPKLSDLQRDRDYTDYNALALRNTLLANLLDTCALTLPIHQPGEAPVGLQLIGKPDGDTELLSIGNLIETALIH